ncbi:MAG: hypothetical protein M3033_03595 [Acidobacteriota bacterium]|nr:hypothetical protein [Acidobacteriota bacterium]
MKINSRKFYFRAVFLLYLSFNVLVFNSAANAQVRRPAAPQKTTATKVITPQTTPAKITPPKAEWLAAPAKPVNVSANLDKSKSVTQTITPDGGFIAAIGADGTEYTLKIPKDALLSDEQITMTPLSNVGNLPMDKGFTAGVQLEPEGLRLFRSATLTFETKEEIPADEQVSFAYFNRGDDAHLYPISPDPHKIEFKLFHFSGYGFGRASHNDRANVNILKNTGSIEARLTAHLAEVLKAARDKALQGKEDEANDILKDAFNDNFFFQYYDEVVRPLMRVAESDDNMASCAIVKYLGWERQVQMLGASGDEDDCIGCQPKAAPPAPKTAEEAALRAATDKFHAEIKKREQEAQTSMNKILENLYEKSQKRALEMCREHDFSFVSYLLGIELQMQLLGMSKSSNVNAIVEKLNKCMVFEVEFDSIIENKAANVDFYFHVKSKFEYDLSKETARVAPLEYVKFAASGNLASLMGNDGSLGGGLVRTGVSGPISAEGTKPGNFILYKIGWDMNVKQVEGTNCEGEAEKQQKQVAENFYVLFDPGKPTEITGHINDTTHEKTSMEDKEWAYHWEHFHAKELYNPFEESQMSYLKIASANENNEAKQKRILAELEALALGDEVKPTEKKSGDEEESVEEGREESTTFRVALKPVGGSPNPGTWRTDFKKSGDNPFGIILTENGYILVRHTPKL